MEGLGIAACKCTRLVSAMRPDFETMAESLPAKAERENLLAEEQDRWREQGSSMNCTAPGDLPENLSFLATA
jgi:hypothetical protein